VWAALQAGARNYGEMAKQLTVSKATIVESVAALERVGAVSRKGRSLVVNDGGDAIVKAATKEEA
jgi:predicted transcriptional regulator